MGVQPAVPPHRAGYGDPPRVKIPPIQGAHRRSAAAGQPSASAPAQSGSVPAQAPTLDYSSRGTQAWAFWTAQWWRRPRNLMAAGLAIFALGLGMTLTRWPFPALLMAAGAFLVGLALPVRDEP